MAAKNNNQAATTKRSVHDALRSLRWDFLGFGLCRAWATGLLTFAASSVWPGDGFLSSQSFVLPESILYLFTGGGAAIMLALSRTKIAAAIDANQPQFVLTSVTLGILGLMCLMTGKPDGDSALFFGGLLLTGLCSGLYGVAWGTRLVTLHPTQVQTYTLAVMALSSLLGIVFGLLPDSGFCLLTALLMFASAALFISSPNSPALFQSSSKVVSAESQKHSTQALTNIFVALFVFSIIYELVGGLSGGSSPLGSSMQIRFWGNLIAALLLIVFMLLGRPIGVVQLFRLILPITAIGFVIYLLVPSSLGWLSLVISSVGRKLFDILTWVIVARAIQEYALSPARHFALLFVWKSLGSLIGSVLSMVFQQGQGTDLVQAATFVPVFILVLIVCFFWLFPERIIDNLFNAVSPDLEPPNQPFEERATALAAEHKLTPRETEVFLLLAKGRSLSVIMEKLSISKGTAHTHVSHIYQKLDVHSQQELIELVESHR